jgi:hypothetical protein
MASRRISTVCSRTGSEDLGLSGFIVSFDIVIVETM